MTLDSLFTAESVACDIHATSKKQLFKEMAQMVEATGELKDTDVTVRDIINAIAERERLGSTGVGTGVALPHARLDGISKVHAAFARLETALDYDAIDERPVDLVAFLIAPSEAGGEHLRALAQISRKLRREDVRARLRAAPDAASLHIILTEDREANAA